MITIHMHASADAKTAEGKDTKISSSQCSLPHWDKKKLSDTVKRQVKDIEQHAKSHGMSLLSNHGGHEFWDRKDGLAHCKVCGGAEADLPTTCPGVPIPETLLRAIQAKDIDFIGEWLMIPKPPASDA